ncbi:Valine--pyruvate aminotransferase [Mucor velutinosus]|uniref:Valine--pyruvate aminotransferase n=1 Tax=Mucor velutinosus TaxID=708070 RepID=A0AAN7DSS1_9FUNG|nr:Valine--pyruvate aminotransferase [Mucor velutinosus]
MSGFFGSNEATSRWGGYFKQAISNVETTFDSLLEQPQTQQLQPSTTVQDKDTETETYVDPISGMVTTIEKPKKPKASVEKKPEPPAATKLLESRSSSDLSSRLAAVMAEKSKRADKFPRHSRKAPEGTPEAKVDEKVIDKEATLKDEKEAAPTIEDNKVEGKEEGDADAKEEEKEQAAATSNADSQAEASSEAVQDEVKSSATFTDPLQADMEESVTKDVAPKDDTNSTPDATAEKALQNDKKTDDVDVSAPASAEKPSKIKADTAMNKDTKQASAKANSNHIENDEKDRILEQRETQLMQVMENITKLHDQMQQLQDNAVKKENQLQAKIDQLEAEIKQNQGENAQAGSPAILQKSVKRLEATVDDLKKQMLAKDEKIQGLLHEGEKLSKVELKHSTTIKKLRLEKTEADKNIAELTKKLEKATSDLSQASQKGTKQTENERRLQESVKLLQDLTEQQTKHINKLESEKLVTQKKLTETETSLKKLQNSMEEERNKAKLEAEKVNAAALEKEIKANDRLHKELTKLKENAESLETKLRKEIRELQIALQTVEEQAGQREDDLRQELADLQTKLQQSDSRMDDINASVDEATAPLLRQIEELQSQHALAIKTRDQAEQSMVIRMQAAEDERKRAIEKDTKLQEEANSLNERLEQAESELEKLRSQVTTLEAQVEADNVVRKELEERIQVLIKEKAELNEKEAKDQEGLKSQYQHLMKERLAEERKQFEIKLKAAAASSASSTPTLDQDSDDVLVNKTKHVRTPSISSRSSFDSSSTTPAVVSSILVERLQANIRQLENQLSFYQTQLHSSSQSRDELSEEVLSMTQEMEQLRKEVKKTRQLEEQHQQLNDRYQTLLELLGEKAEQVEELKADLQDVKEMYKSQIIDLVQKIDHLNSNKK